MKPITTVILAGGETLVARLAKTFLPLGEVVISVAEKEGDPAAAYGLEDVAGRVRFIADAYEKAGPAAGILSALTAARQPGYVFVLACDMPFAGEALLEDLMQAAFEAEATGTPCEAVVPREEGGRAHPLAALYHTDLADRLAAFLESGQRKVGLFLEQCKVVYLPVATKGQKKQLTNVNAPADYADALRKDQRPDAAQLSFMALCLTFGLFAKKIIAPFTNVITDFIRLPGGGAATAFSLMFIVVATGVVRWRYAGTVCGLVQGLLALFLGMSGYQGAMAVITYTLPGVAIDVVRWLMKDRSWVYFTAANFTANVISAVGSNLLVFRFHGRLLLLWLLVAGCFGVAAGLLGAAVHERLLQISEYKKLVKKGGRGEPIKETDMKRAKRMAVGLISALLLVTTVAACANRGDEAESIMTLTAGDQEIEITAEDLDQTDFSGTLVNGKGDSFTNEYRGVEVAELLKAKDIEITEDSVITITAADNYSAEYTGAEAMESGKLYLATEENGEAVEPFEEGGVGVNCVIFGDKDSKRCVRFVTKLDVSDPK